MSNLAYGTFTITNLSAVTSVDVYYYNSTSSTSLSGGSWSTDTPTWTNGKYIWSKTVTTWEQGVTTESEPVCITGQKGSTGAAGQSVTKITQQYALGTSSTTAPTTGWSTTMPAFESGKFYWTRSEIVWANPTNTTYTTAVLANGITSANTTANTANTNAQSAVSTANSANTKADSAVSTANTANQTAQNAVSIANGKNAIYYSSSKPTGGTYKAGDTWFNLTSDGYRIYEYNATAKDWVQKSMDGKSITAGTVTAAQIQAGAITTNKLATNAIKSNNYNAGTAPYSLTGTFLDLSNGNIFTPNFGVNNDSTDNIDNGAYIKGTIQAYDGKIGSDTNNYWYIGNYFDYNQGQSAMIRSHGTAAIQLGDSSTWRLSTNRIHTAWNDDSTSGQAFRLHYLSYDGKYWDSGLHVPTSATDKLLYIRNASTSTSLENLQNDIDDNSGGNFWNYQFYLTNDGSLYAKNIYIMDESGNTTQIGGTNGVYLLKSGGTIENDLVVNKTLKVLGNYLNKNGNAITLQTNLNSTTAGTLTGNTTSAINIGITGTLPTSNGGTGNTSYTTGGVVYVDGSNPKKLLSTAAGTSGYLLKSGGTGAPTWVDPGTLTVAAAAKDGDGNVIKTTYLKLTGGNVTGPVSFGDSVSIDDLNAGNLVVTGNASFTNNINANTINGVTVGSSPKFTDTTYAFDNGYSASNNKGATVLTVTNAIGALNVNPINGATNKTLTSISETAGKISATYSNISITKSQVSDFPTSMPASDVSAWAKASTKPSYKQDEILPLQSKTFTGVIGTENNWANATFFFGSIKPATWGEIWRIKYRIKVFVPGQPNYNQMADVMISGRAGDLKAYASLNTIGAYYVCYYHELYRMKEAGFNNGYGHSLGVRFYSAYNPTDTNYKRTIDVEILETENCTFSFYDNCLVYADIPGTGSTNYNGYSEIDFVNSGLRETGDDNDPNYYNRTYYSSRTTSAALYRYQFCLTKSDGTLVPVNSVNNSVATNKTLTIDNFDPFGQIFYYNYTGTANANTNVGNSVLYRQYLCDLRYSFNCGGYDTTPTLTARMPLYLVATPQADGTAKLYIEPLSMYLPSSEDGLIYIYLGRVYEDTKPYRVALSLNHPIYEYRNGAVRLYTGLKSETAASGGTNVSLVTTGQKYLWNSKTSNTGTVTSVAASGSGGITIGGSPITTSGTLAIGLNLSTAINGLGEGTSPANRDDYTVVQYAGGGTTTTSYHRRKLSNVFKALIADDIPNLAWSKITSGNDDLKAIENLTGTTGLLKKTAANTWTLDTSAYVTSSGVTSITLTQGTGISIGSSGTAITSTGTRTISLADNYGDIKNPYASKTARYVLAAPAAENGVPSFRALTKEDVGLNNVLNYGQVTAIGQGDNGTLRVWTGDPTSTSTDDYEDIALTITAYNQSTVSKAGALNLSAAVGSTSKPVYFKADGKPYEISYTIEKSVPSNAVFTDTWNKVSTSQDGYVTKLPGNTTTFLRGDGSWGTPVGTTYTFDGTYNASSNKAATVSTVTNAINALDGNLNNTTPGAGKTLTAFSQTDGKISATFGNISITKSQISDFPSSMAPTAHTHAYIVTEGDNRSVSTTPNDYTSNGGYPNRIIFRGLKSNSYINSPSSDTYSYLIGLRGWSDDSGGNAHEIAFNNNGIFRRNGATNTWGSWYKLIDSGNYNSYSPTLTGIGASGTWGISISGNAATATTAVSATTATIATTATKANITTVVNSIAKYSDTSGTFTDSYITIDSSGNLIIGDNDHPANIKMGAKNDNYGLMPNVNNYGQIGSSSLYWYRGYINNYYGTNSHVNNWDSNKNIGTAATSSASSTRGNVNFYNTCAAGGTQTKTNLTADASTASDITVTLPSETGKLALTKNYQPYAHYSNTNGSNSGKYYKISINSYTGWMLSFTIRIYHTYRAYDLQISGYNYGSNHWYSPSAIILGSSVTTSIDVLFGYDSDYHLWVAIPAEQYTGIDVVNVTNGYQQVDNLEGLFTIEMIDSEPTTVQNTKTAYRPWYRNETVTTAISATSAGALINKTLDSLTLNSTAGTFSFQGSGAPWDGTDWVGLQVGSNDDKFQIHALNGTTLEYRQNDSGGTNSNWGNWYSLLSAGNYTDYTVTKTGSGASGTWGISITGNAATATKWTSAQTVYVTLGTASTSTTIQGGSSSAQTIGVNGTLAVANGGTGKTTTADAINNLLGGLPIWSANPSDSTYFIRQDTGGAASYGKVPFSTLWSYIKGKSDSTYVTLTTEQTITGRKTFNDIAAVTFKPSSGTDKCNINYDATLGALVFSF